MKDYRGYSFWLETVTDDLTPRPSLVGSIDVDVAILGAGYSGLWTAFYLTERDPELRIAIVEREIAGFGASGRNGSWVSSGFPLSPGMLIERYGTARTRALELAMFDSIDEIGRVCDAEGIDAQFRKNGVLRIARGKHQLPALRNSYNSYAELGLADDLRILDAVETAALVRVAGAEASLASPHCANIQPAALVRGLARVVERRGVTIYEGTTVTGFSARRDARLETDRGDVRAGAILLCGESYLSRLPALHRQIIPVYSLIGLTEPLADDQWGRIGWSGGEALSSFRYTVDYLAKTCDGRILFGSRGAPYHYGSRIEDSYDRHGPTHAAIQRLFHDWFPQLGDVRFTHSWGGPVGMPRDQMPTVAFDPATRIGTARGYTGQGVATSNLAGRVLADLVADTPSPLRDLPFVDHQSPNWEPEPLRWLGVRYVQEGFGR